MGNTVSQKMLGIASRLGDAAGARKAVVEDGADANAAVYWDSGIITTGGTCTAAYVAARCGRCGVLGVLLAAPVSADPDKGDTRTGWTPCHIACAEDRPDAVAALLAHGADPNIADKSNGYTPCMWVAMFSGSVPCLRALAAGGPGGALVGDAVNTVCKDEGITALDLAQEANNAEFEAVLHDELGGKRAADL